MKKLLVFLSVMILCLCFGTVARANNIASSTMHFEGPLTYADGEYSGTIPMTAGEYYVPGGPGASIWTGGGFDVYAKEGACAYVEGYYGTGAWNCDGTDTAVIGSNHDAYPAGGPWGIWYDPDCADWDKYELELTDGHWYLRYAPTNESPMSGVMDWKRMYAVETDLGTQVYAPPGSAFYGGGSQAWDWDCGWGVEVVPLELIGFKVEITETTTSGVYHVVLTPCGASVGYCISTLIEQNCSEFKGTIRANCVHEQIGRCHEFFGISSQHN